MAENQEVKSATSDTSTEQETWKRFRRVKLDNALVNLLAIQRQLEYVKEQLEEALREL